MYKRDIYLDIDDNLNNYIKSVELDSNSRVWHFHLTVDYQPLNLTGKTVMFMAEKPDKTNVLNDCEIIDAENGIVKVELTRQVNAVPGHVNCLLKIVGSDGYVLKTKTFIVEVSKTLSDKPIVSTNEFSALDEALGRVQNIDRRFAETNAQLLQTKQELSSQLEHIKYKTINYTNVKDYEYLVNDGDWSPVISFCETLGKQLIFPKGEYLIKSYLTKKSHIDWIGEGEDSVILVNDSFNYKSDNNIVIKNENYNSSLLYDTFSFTNLCFKYNVTDTTKPIYFLAFISTKNITVTNCKFDSSSNNLLVHIVMDFKGNNQNTIIDNCESIYNTSASTHEGNTLCFRNFSSIESNGIIIKNSSFTRLCGGDEIIWICANVGNIRNILIENNKLKSVSDNTQTSGIYILQTDTGLTGTYFIDNVTISNNIIDINNLKYSAIKIGSGLETVPKMENITIFNNKINVTNGDNTTSSAIQLNNVINSNIQTNTITGTYWRVITNADNVLNNNINTTDSDGVVVNCVNARDNVINTSYLGTKNTTNIINNIIKCKSLAFSVNKIYSIKDNKISGDANVRLMLCVGKIADDENLTAPVLNIENNIFKNTLGVIDYNFNYVILINNLAYINASGYAIESEIIKYANNNTIQKPDGTELNDSKMALSDANSIPYNFRLSLPLGHKILSLTDFKTYTKTQVGDSSSSWIKEP